MTKEELKKFRKDHKLTQTELADLVGVQVSAVSKWEQGQRKIPQSTIKILNMYDPSVDGVEKSSKKEGGIEEILTEKLYEKIKPELDGLKKQNRDQSELLIGLASVIEELLNKVSDIQKTVKN